MRRGDVVVVAHGKPRPAVIVQADAVRTPVEVLICPLSTELVDAPIYRLDVAPNAENGLRHPSQMMIDKIAPARWQQIDKTIGRLDRDALERLETALMVVLDLATA